MVTSCLPFSCLLIDVLHVKTQALGVPERLLVQLVESLHRVCRELSELFPTKDRFVKRA